MKKRYRIPLWQNIFMSPIHLFEGLSVKYRLARPLYRCFSMAYRPFRSFFRFGEELFVEQIRPGDKILDLGTGTGYLLKAVVIKGGWCVGLDREFNMIRKAPRFPGAGHYVISDMSYLPFKEKCFDKCISLGALHCIDPYVFFKGCFKLLKDGGEVMIISEVRTIPIFAQNAGHKSIVTGAKDNGFNIIEEKIVGGIYLWLRAGK